MTEFVAPAAWLVAAAAGGVTAAISAIAMRARGRPAAVGAALARGLAVAFAVIAAFGPVSSHATRVPGTRLAAAPRDAAPGAGGLTLRWPADAPDAAGAIETLRAARDPDSPASLALIAADDVGRARDLGPVTRALRPNDAIDRSVIGLPTRPAPTPLGAAPRILAPAGATDGIPVVLTLDCGDEPFAAGEARIDVDRRPSTIAIPDGARRVTTPPLALSAGTHVVVAEIDGRLPGAAIVEVAGPPRVLVVSADAAAHDAVAMLRMQGLDVADVRANDLRADDVERCAALVLGPGVTGGPLAGAIAARVLGGAGLLVIGGEGRAGLSRFAGTPLASLLPVEPPPPPTPPPAPPAPPPPQKKPDPASPKPALDEGEKEALRVALLLVIDTSGSMSGQKLVMAQQSAVAAAGALAPSDRVSVFAFDDDSREIAPFQDAMDLQGLYRRIGALRASGGTNFYPALKTGYQRILEQRCGIRHVILITDGETRPAVFRDLIENGVSQAVTLSSIAVGDDADTNLLALLARWGRGKLYVANDPARLPEVVTLDTRRFATGKRDEARKDRPKADAEDLPEPPSDLPPVERPGPPEPSRVAANPRRPHVVTRAALLAGLESERWPALPFAETAPPRPASQVVLAWDDGAAALTLGRAGLGRVAAVSAGIASAEAAEFRRWAPAPQFLAQTVRALVAPPASADEPVEATITEADDGRAFVCVAAAGGGRLSLEPVRGASPIDVTCADRGATSIAELSAMPPAGVLAGTFTAPGAAPRRALAVSPGRRPLRADAAAAVARASGADEVASVPEPRDGAPLRHDEPAGLAYVAGAAAILVVEAALRRQARSGA